MESQAYADFTPVLIEGKVDILFCGVSVARGLPPPKPRARPKLRPLTLRFPNPNSAHTPCTKQHWH